MVGGPVGDWWGGRGITQEQREVVEGINPRKVWSLEKQNAQLASFPLPSFVSLLPIKTLAVCFVAG